MENQKETASTKSLVWSHKRPDKVMTATEDLAANINDWHEVCWNVDGFGNVSVRYLSCSLSQLMDGEHD